MDFIKLSTKDKSIIESFRTNPLLEWMSNEDKFNRHDPEVITTKDKYQYKGIIFCFYPNELKISFLPHYYFNNNLHNANDFKVIDCVNMILDFKNTFEIDLECLKIINLEFGINIVSPIDIKDLIMFLAYHNQNEFRTDNEYPYSKKSYRINKQNKPNDYKIIKAYAKGIQFPDFCDRNTFRFEIKSDQSKYYNPYGIFNLNDLLNIDVYTMLSTKLIEEFNKVLILDDTIDFSNLNPKQQSELKEYLHPNFWYRLKQDSQRNKFNKEKTKYYKLLDKTGNHLKKQLENIIIDKLEYLKSGADSTPLLKTKTDAFSTLYNNGIGTNNKTTICRVTGLDISMQKESLYLSHSGLKYYFENDIETFDKLKNNHLPKLWSNSDFEIQIKELAHNIRTKSNNRKNKQIRIYPKQQTDILNQLGI